MARRLVVLVTALAVVVPAALATSLSFHDSVSAGDPDQKGELLPGDPATSCDSPTTAELGDANLTNYDSYRFRNTRELTTCVTVELALDPLLCPVANPLQSAAYRGAFDPSAITANYLGDIGATPDPTKSYSFNVEAGQNFDVTVNETNPNAGCNGYTLTVTGEGIVGSPTSVGVRSFTAGRIARGVILRWVAVRGGGLGYNVYGEGPGRRTRLNRSLIRGTSWLARRIAARYWLEEIRPDGSRRWYGPAGVGGH